ncbi:MAG TPA: flagellar type III secretion system pore protein FliP [Candidatus Binatia bacterium]|nr:flagellar type III secretion system pore protein FliP [Candidatus Binatia bacterium]
MTIVGRLAGFGLLAVVLGGCAGSGAPSVSVQIGDGSAGSGGGTFALSLQLLVALTVLAVAPAILLMATSFTRIVVVLSLLRSAIGIPNLPPNQVLLGLALFLTLFVMAPVWGRIQTEAVEPYLAGRIDEAAAFAAATEPLRGFMLGQTRESDLATFIDLSRVPRPATAADVPLEVLVPAFVTSELRTAFTMGFLLFVPFLVIDLVVASALMSMGMVMVPPTQIALPFKLLLFVLVDGWVLVVGSLVQSFG